jgi:UDP-N-acetyl-D-mannosaminuronate dehydrogenase
VDGRRRGGLDAVNTKQTVVVVGLGEIGKPLFEIVSKVHNAFGVDIAPMTENPDKVDVMHICIPFAIPDFIGESVRYIQRFKPALTIINSTVSVGTTRAIAERSGAAVVNSPVRGKHIKMVADLLHYQKFIGPMDAQSGGKAAEHFESIGLKTKTLAAPEATELAKLTETTYFGLMIAWAQELERYCDKTNQNYEEVISFYDEIKFFPPVKYFPGVIGGHCVMPNIEILNNWTDSVILRAVEKSNQQKIERDAHLAKQQPQMATATK